MRIPIPHPEKSLLAALAKIKPYTPADPQIFRMMMKAGLGVDPKNIRGTAPLPMGRLGPARGLTPPLRTGPLEFGGPRPTAPPARVRGKTLEQALASNKRAQRPGIPTGLSAQAKAKRGEPYGFKNQDTVRLYRGEHGKNKERGRWFTTDRSLAEAYGNKRLVSVDVPKDIAKKSLRGRSKHYGKDDFDPKAGGEFVLPREWSARAKTHKPRRG